MFGGDDQMDFEAARDRMVDRLRKTGRIERETTAEAMWTIPRHEFVPEGRRRRAYEDTPLPIGEDQTISAPHMVATMLDRLALEPGDEVLEIGTGCGYHAAVTAAVVGPENVASVEYYEELAEQARTTLADLGYEDVRIRVGDGHEGWPDEAPFDATYLTCAAGDVPEAVVEQVRPGGTIVAPIGDRRQRLVVADRMADGSLRRETHGGVRFVPMRGGEK